MITGAFATDQHRLERLRTLTEVSRALTYATSIDEVLRMTVARAAELMGAEKTVIMLTDADGLLVVRAACGVDDQRVNAFREPLNETLIRRLQGLLDYELDESFLSVPLVAQGQVTGLLAAVRTSGEPSTADDEWLLSALADQAAVALENARLTQAVREERDEHMRMVEAQGRAHATLGHELRSPLTSVQAYSSLLLDGVFGPLNDRQRESIGRIRLSGEHLLAIIENVLDVARLNAGAIKLSSRAVPIADVLSEAVEMLQPLALEKEQALRTKAAHEWVVQADPTRLRQALVNLIGNAIKYTPQRGTIQVNVSTSEREGRPFVAIAVTDTGRGMTRQTLETIFEPYDRGGAATHEGGLGLGLFISRELVRQMRGDIEVQSEPGSGSTFTAYVPLASDAERDPVDRDASE
jgi:phosphoserine phosphatase RsbU/P